MVAAPNTLDLHVVEDLLTTTRAVRRRLDYDRRVEREVILDCIRQAQQAPTIEEDSGHKKRKAMAVASDGEA